MTSNVQTKGAMLLSRMEGVGVENKDQDTYIYEACDPADQNDKLLGWYDWLADCVMTSHICNNRDSFNTYKPDCNTVAGVGNVKANIMGKGQLS